MFRKTILCLLPITLAKPLLFAQTVNVEKLGGLKYRLLGLHRGGRMTASCGVPTQPFTFYFGATGGGIWKTADAGLSWKNVSDGYFNIGSTGALAVAPSDPNVIYADTGSAEPRGNVSK